MKIFFLVTVFAAGAWAQAADYSAIFSALTTQCAKNNPEGKVPDFTATMNTFNTCLHNLVNATELKQEIEQAKPNGALDEVFKKYCDKTPQLKTCINTVIDTVSSCVESKHANAITTFRNGTEQVIDFVCYKDGDRIAMFIAESGPECFEQKKESLKACGLALREKFTSFEQAATMSLAEKCRSIDELTSCMVTALEQCSTPTPANMVESLIKFIRKGSPCPVTN